MNLYKKTLESLKIGTFDNHLKTLNEIGIESTDSELRNHIYELINSLGNIPNFSPKSSPCTLFEINEGTNERAKDLIEYCKQCLE